MFVQYTLRGLTLHPYSQYIHRIYTQNIYTDTHPTCTDKQDEPIQPISAHNAWKVLFADPHMSCSCVCMLVVDEQCGCSVRFAGQWLRPVIRGEPYRLRNAQVTQASNTFCKATGCFINVTQYPPSTSFSQRKQQVDTPSQLHKPKI